MLRKILTFVFQNSFVLFFSAGNFL